MRADTSVCTVVAQAGERLELALAAQSRPPDTTIRHSGALGRMLRSAHATQAEWIWLLDESAAPRPDALLALLQALARLDGLPEPAVLAGVVLTPGGEVDIDLAAWYRGAPTEIAMAAVDRRLLPIRAAPAPVLVHRRAVESEPGPRGSLVRPAAVLEWTARVLRSGHGYCVPESVSVSTGSGRGRVGGPLGAAALLMGGAFRGAERLRVGLDLLERAGTGLSRRAR